MGGEILLGHGGGGLLTMELIEQEILSRFGEGPLADLPDGATLPIDSDRLVISTDSFVVKPLEFPGGDVGSLSIHGTVNDVAVSGGLPRYVSLALILEEGLDLQTLRRILDSIARAADECSVSVVTGDTKVVERGLCDGMYINTTGVGEPIPGLDLGPGRIRPSDRVVVSGNLGDHGMAVMSAREGIRIENGPLSDTGPVHRLVRDAAEFGSGIRFLRDPTRGGLAAVANEMVRNRSFGVEIRETDLPFSRGGKALAEMLGLDLLHVASEGRVVAVCSGEVADTLVKRWRDLPEGRNARIIGTVTEDRGRVLLRTVVGTRRLIDVPHGELLPRIC